MISVSSEELWHVALVHNHPVLAGAEEQVHVYSIIMSWSSRAYSWYNGVNP